MFNQIKAKLIARKFRKSGVKPTIIRERIASQGYGITVTKLFVRVDQGKLVEYYAKQGTPFHNLYRVVSKPDSDFVIHQAR